MAMDMNGNGYESAVAVGYRGYVQLVGLVTVAVVVMICLLHSVCNQRHKQNNYAYIEDPAV